MTVSEAASYFRVSTTSIYRGRDIFSALRLVPVNGRRMVLRSDVEVLDQQLRHQAESDGGYNFRQHFSDTATLGSELELTSWRARRSFDYQSETIAT